MEDHLSREWAGRQPVWLVGLATAVGVAGLLLVLLGPYWGCRYYVAREGYSVPRLVGLTLAEARNEVRRCISVVPAEPAGPGATIVSQAPGPPDVVGKDRVIRVLLK